jgi:rubrerythrin
MKKDDFLKKINEAAIIEEQAISVYCAHMKVIFSWHKLSKDKNKFINDVFDKLIKESKKHRMIIEKINEKLKTRNGDV